MNLLRTIVSDPLTYLLVAGFWLGRVYIERRLRRGVDARFDEKLEEHKHALSLLTEQARFDFQRRLADFNLFAERKHVAAAKLWEAARIAHGYVVGLYGVNSELTFEEFNAEDMRAHLDGLGVPKGKQDEVLGGWASDRKAAVARLRPYLAMLRYLEAERKLKEAQNTAYLNELYFPDDVIQATTDLFKELSDWLFHRKHPGQTDGWTPDAARAQEPLERLHEVLRVYVGTNAVEGSR